MLRPSAEGLRLADANRNRLREGLRVLEDMARFILDDANLTQRLKGLRHDLAGGGGEALLGARRAGEDVGAFAENPDEARRPDIASLVMANARRAQESLRVLEELGKLPGWAHAPDSDTCKRARFALYEVEQTLVSRVLRQEKRGKVRGLYVILDPQQTKGRAEAEVARAALRGGAGVLQLRDKTRDKGQLLPLALELGKLCAEAGALFIVNDDIDLALAAGADGVHLGQKDLPLGVARRVLPLGAVVGRSTATLEEALRAQEEGADYIAVGAIYPTTSKASTRPAGLATLRQVKKAVSAPVVAIGGINEGNLAEVVKAGADAAAVISAVMGAEDVEGAARKLASLMKG